MSDSDILARLTELDKTASGLVEEAQAVLDDTLSGIEEETERFRKTCAEESSRRVDAVRQEEEKASQEQLESISQRYRALAEGLEKTYEERHGQWEEEIFQRCVRK